MSSSDAGAIRRRTRAALAVALVVQFAWAPAGAVQRRPLVPGRQSPLATDGRRFYAVGADGQSILVADGDRSWNLLTTIAGAQIRGMAWAGERLYVTNVADASVLSVATTGDRRAPVVVHRGAPLRQPLDIAVANALVIADAGAGALVRIDIPGGGASLPGAPTTIRGKAPVGITTFLAGSREGEVIVSDTDTGVLAQLTDLGSGDAKYRPMQEKGESDSPVPWNQKPEKPQTLRRQGYPGVSHPGSVAVMSGILYVVDVNAGALFTAGVHDVRAIRVATPWTEAAVTRIVATPQEIVGLDVREGRLLRIPRVVPAEVTLLPTARPQSLFPVVEYLHRRGMLATRTVPLAGSVATTLAQSRMAWPVRPQAVPYDGLAHYASFCLLNATLCVGGMPRPDIPPGTPLVLSDFYSERFTTATQVRLDGTQTLGAVVDAAVTSPEFRTQTTEEHLRRLNAVTGDRPAALLSATEGTFRISQEQIRYVIPVPAGALRANDDFRRLAEVTKPTLRISPLERVLSSAAGLEQAHPNDPSCLAARAAWSQLLATINFTAAKQTRPIFVGVAEEGFDATHPDFHADASVLYSVTDEAELVPAPPPPRPVPESTPGHEPVTWRPYAADDHGTAVAALIAGRQRSFTDAPGLTDALIAMFTHTSDLTALAHDIERALDVSPMTVVNLSLKAKSDAEKLRVLMEDKVDVALFVVAAPNSATNVTLCTGTEVWYPACHGRHFANVLVVGGTSLDGTQLHARSPKGQFVHLFAPSAGYFAAGRNNAYVAVEGTSFATALVSAAAAMLSSAGVSAPALIRQRLVATADLMSGLDVTGPRLLNVKRALTSWEHAVMVEAGTGRQQAVTIMNRNARIDFRPANGNGTIPVTVGKVRRLRRLPGATDRFELAYVGSNGMLELALVRAPEGAWNVCYIPVASSGGPGQQACTDLAEAADYVGPTS